MKKMNYGLAKIDYTHWVLICSVDADNKLVDNQIKMYLERSENISISKCKEIDEIGGKKRFLLDVATEENYYHFLDLFRNQNKFVIQKQTTYMTAEGIADDYEQIKGIVAKLRGRLVTGKMYQNNSDLIVSDNSDRFYNQQYPQQTDEFSELYESLKISSSNYESNLRKEVDSILNTMHPNSTTNLTSETTQMTCLENGTVRRFY